MRSQYELLSAKRGTTLGIERCLWDTRHACFLPCHHQTLPLVIKRVIFRTHDGCSKYNTLGFTAIPVYPPRAFSFSSKPARRRQRHGTNGICTSNFFSVYANGGLIIYTVQYSTCADGGWLRGSHATCGRKCEYLGGLV